MDAPSPYFALKADLARYNPRWYDELHVVDIATWMCSWNDDQELLRFYVDANAERKTALTLWDLAHASKLAKAAYVALSPEAVLRLVSDPVLIADVNVAVAAKCDFRLAQRSSMGVLAGALKSLLPRFPYNTDRGDRA